MTEPALSFLPPPSLSSTPVPTIAKMSTTLSLEERKAALQLKREKAAEEEAAAAAEALEIQRLEDEAKERDEEALLFADFSEVRFGLFARRWVEGRAEERREIRHNGREQEQVEDQEKSAQKSRRAPAMTSRHVTVKRVARRCAPQIQTERRL